ncbi:MAG: chorion class high-cysteine HCB protein 13 [Clostridia bacterium]|nr:chorion class high-cysteine HCB protein 13 [Clostridia bacterium]
MFDGMFGGQEHGHDGGHGCGDNCCTWIILILLFCFCCSGKKKWHISINPCCILLALGLLYCCGGIKLGKDC